MARVTPRRSDSLRLSTVVAVVLALVTAITAPMVVIAAEAPPEVPAEETAPAHAEDHIVVKMEAPPQAMRAMAAGGVEVAGDWLAVPVPEGKDAAAYAEEMAARPGVEAAEVDPILHTQASPPFISPDPFYNDTGATAFQWHLHAANVGAAWLSTVGAGVTVAVLDTGVTQGSDGFCHPFVSEYNAQADVAGPGSALDNDGHGSHVAGSVAQCSDNGIGGAGMAPEASIMPVKVFPSEGGADAFDVARGIDWAVSNGARVINMSVGCPGCDSQTMNEAIGRAAAAGVVMVASSGNSPIDVYYPANHPAVLGVGASTRSGEIASYSARGPALDLVAPGGAPSGDPGTFIWQDTSAGYTNLAGTSMASAHVSGAAALLVSRYPGSSAGRVKSALMCGASDMMATGRDNSSGAGLLNAWGALEQLRLMNERNTDDCVGQPASHAPFASIQTSAGIWRLNRGQAQVATFYYGNPGDYGFMGDWDCDGIKTPGLYRQSDGFAYLRNSNSEGVADVRFFFGNPGDVPLAGDFDGDGCDTLSLYRPAEGRYYIINRLGSGDTGLGVADHAYYFGDPGDAPFMGDWDGDRIDTPGLRRPSNGFVYLRHSNSQGVADVEYFYGDPGDVVFTGDWDADGADTLGLYRPSAGVVYLRNTNSTGVADLSIGVGFGMHPVGGDH
jgi:serine protease